MEEIEMKMTPLVITEFAHEYDLDLGTGNTIVEYITYLETNDDYHHYGSYGDKSSWLAEQIDSYIHFRRHGAQ